MNLEDFDKKHTILDAELLEILISKSGGVLKVEITFILRDGLKCKFTFNDVLSYDFCYDNKHGFYTVTDYVLAKQCDSYYLSLDPYDGRNGINEKDLDCIKSNELIILFEE